MLLFWLLIQPVPLLFSPLSAIPALYRGQFARAFPQIPPPNFHWRLFLFTSFPGLFSSRVFIGCLAPSIEPNRYPFVLGRVQCPPKNKIYPGLPGPAAERRIMRGRLNSGTTGFKLPPDPYIPPEDSPAIFQRIKNHSNQPCQSPTPYAQTQPSRALPLREGSSHYLV